MSFSIIACDLTPIQREIDRTIDAIWMEIEQAIQDEIQRQIDNLIPQNIQDFYTDTMKFIDDFSENIDEAFADIDKALADFDEVLTKFENSLPNLASNIASLSDLFINLNLAPTSSTTYIINRDDARARECPDTDNTNCPVRAIYNQGDEIEVIERVLGESYAGSTNWLRIRIEGDIAYIHSSLAVPVYTPEFTSQNCSRYNVNSEYNATCGYVEVPLYWHEEYDPEQTLRLAVVVINSENETASPIVYLSGGPGGKAIRLGEVDNEFVQIFSPDRRVIFFDQRGTGLSISQGVDMNCSDINTSRDAIVIPGLSFERQLEIATSALEECHNSYVRQGFNAGALTSFASANDMNAIREALDINTWNVYGLSYGTRLALTYIREFDDDVNAVILDGAYGPEATLTSIIIHADASRERILGYCKDDEACNIVFPNIEHVFDNLLNYLRENPPIEVERNLQERVCTFLFKFNCVEPETEIYDVDDIVLLNTIFLWSYSEEAIPYIPSLIWYLHERSQGHEPPVPDSVILLNPPNFDSSSMTNYTVHCHDEYRFENQSQLDSMRAQHGDYLELFGVFDQAMLNFCHNWYDGYTPEGNEMEIVRSVLPILILSGELDPITPSNMNGTMTPGLTNVEEVVFERLTHITFSQHSCPQAIASAFINNPDAPIDRSCANSADPISFRTP